MKLMKVVKALAVTAVLALSLMAASGSADARSLRVQQSTIIVPVVQTTTLAPVVGGLGVTWE